MQERIRYLENECKRLQSVTSIYARLQSLAHSDSKLTLTADGAHDDLRVTISFERKGGGEAVAISPTLHEAIDSAWKWLAAHQKLGI
jgi:hypothetical protein